MADQKTREEVGGLVKRRISQSESLLGRMGISDEAYERVVLNALVRNPALADCNRDSLDIAVADCIQSGLLPDGREAAIVPFRDGDSRQPNATLIPMIAGKVKLAKAATPGIALHSDTVYSGDLFEYSSGAQLVLKHTPGAFCDPPRQVDRRDEHIIAVYAVAHLPGGTVPEYEVFDRATINQYRAYSKAQRGPWNTHFSEMAEKAVMGQLLKRLPRAVVEPPERITVDGRILDALEIGDDVGEDGVVDGAPTRASAEHRRAAPAEPVEPDPEQEPEPEPAPRQRQRRAPAQPAEPQDPPDGQQAAFGSEPPPAGDDGDDGDDDGDDGDAPF